MANERDAHSGAVDLVEEVENLRAEVRMLRAWLDRAGAVARERDCCLDHLASIRAAASISPFVAPELWAGIIAEKLNGWEAVRTSRPIRVTKVGK